MVIQEALNRGKRRRRRGWPAQIILITGENGMLYLTQSDFKQGLLEWHPADADLRANDWEISPAEKFKKPDPPPAAPDPAPGEIDPS